MQCGGDVRCTLQAKVVLSSGVSSGSRPIVEYNYFKNKNKNKNTKSHRITFWGREKWKSGKVDGANQ